MSFKPDMVWGAATASYQIEGGWDADGKGPSVWDRMARWPGKVKFGDTGNVSSDHYHRYPEDVAIMKEIGLQAYRFSLSWPRIMPEGKGAVNQAGLDFYSRLVDSLLETGITPWVTLFHWDYPLHLFYEGGWMNSASPQWFEDYTEVVVKALGDRVKHWITHNEPQMFIGLGHEVGEHAPGMKHPRSDLARMIHHTLLAHGKSCRKIREHVDGAQIGWATANGAFQVADPSDEGVVAQAKADLFDYTETGVMAFQPAVWNDPAFFGKYPENFLRLHGQSLPKGWEEDMAAIQHPLDFSGFNTYNAARHYFRNEQGEVAFEEPWHFGNGFPRTHFQWAITPECLYWTAVAFYERYQAPIAILENGLSGADWVHTDGKCHDYHRIDFLTRYLSNLRRAAKDGVDVAAYFQWSLLDNFEWAEGYNHRFGLVHVDYETLKRTPKDSAYWYSEVIKSNGTNF
ncbi:GH1 family beta-glucosidase [Cerasicoccus fimbriatus]|uniref:GH1 family beta-glucosidase n=1 Tax=Cerasicoccus fimbriatus TaxID=3014554 RepID=UPI0022B4E726|nr:GH1 family beta-glucosidase [Cerasicoccus sp. TK19100]